MASVFLWVRWVANATVRHSRSVEHFDLRLGLLVVLLWLRKCRKTLILIFRLSSVCFLLVCFGVHSASKLSLALSLSLSLMRVDGMSARVCHTLLFTDALLVRRTTQSAHGTEHRGKDARVSRTTGSAHDRASRTCDRRVS